jgi:hypothetical protein
MKVESGRISSLLGWAAEGQVKPRRTGPDSPSRRQQRSSSVSQWPESAPGLHRPLARFLRHGDASRLAAVTTRLRNETGLTDRPVLLCLALALCLFACGAKTANAPPAGSEEAPSCRALEDRSCFRIDVAARAHYCVIPRARAVVIDDNGVRRTAVPLAALFDAEIVQEPEKWRYKLYATDGFTHGGYATWKNLQHGYIELETRRVVFAASENLPHSFRIKDAFRIEVLPRAP